MPASSASATPVRVVIITLALRLLMQWRRGAFGPNRHRHGTPARTPLKAYGIGLVHGMGGSAGVGVLQIWWLSALGAAALSLRAIERGQFRTTRPVARMFRRQAAVEQG